MSPMLPVPGCQAGICRGFGLHALGEHAPMGPLDAADGMPTVPCPGCGASINPAPDPDAWLVEETVRNLMSAFPYLEEAMLRQLVDQAVRKWRDQDGGSRP